MWQHLRVQDQRLFRQLRTITGGLVEAAHLLRRLLGGPAADAGAVAAAARTLDTNPPASDGAVDVRAFTAFAKRLDPMEFRALALALDAAFESVQGATAHAHALGASQAPANLVALAALLVDAAEALHRSVPAADTPLRPAEGAGSVDRLAGDGESTYYAGVGELFSAPSNPADALRWKDVYDAVHHALGRCIEAAGALHRIAGER